jgi:hypothetical protein
MEQAWSEIPSDIGEMIDQLKAMEAAIIDKPKVCHKGENIIGKMLQRGLMAHFNALPASEPEKCERILFVGVGSRDKVEIRIFQAIEHIHNCSGVTDVVIFWAATWDTDAWMQHLRTFKDVTVILKLFHAEPIRLR